MVHLGLRSILVLFEKAKMGQDGVLLNSYEKSFELTPRLSLFGEAQYDTHDKWEGGAGFSYLLDNSFSLITKWHNDYGFGAGLQIRF